MPRNTDGLKRSARLRSESAMHRALAALQRMDVSDREINFRAVAADAGVSTAWLYSQEGLRIRIMQSRKRQSQLVPPSALQDRERLSRQNIVTTLRVRIKTLEEKNRELTGILELVYGELAMLRERNALVGGAFEGRTSASESATSAVGGALKSTKQRQRRGLP